MKVSWVQTVLLLLVCLSLSACNEHTETPHGALRRVTVITPEPKTITLTQRYVCQIHAHHHVEVCAPDDGYLEEVPIREGQKVRRDDLLFQVRPLFDIETPDLDFDGEVVSVKAPFDGMVHRLRRQQGSLVQKRETLTILYDNSLMWADFNVPEDRYLEYRSANLDQLKNDLKIELLLANGKKFDQPGTLTAIGLEFNAGDVSCRADFPNPDRLLRHGLTGTVLISRVLNDAIVIPQRATFEFLDKRYVFVVDRNNVAHQREIAVQNESDELFVIKAGVGVNDKIILDGVRLIHDGEKVESEGRQPKKFVANVN